MPATVDEIAKTGATGAIRASLHGRVAELEAIERLLADARAGRSHVLVVSGARGLGKSALLDHADATSEGMRVLRAAGAQSESELPFAALHQMLRPLLGLIDSLPAPQASALRSAFGLSRGRVGDRFLISVAALTLLDEAAEADPLLCLVDDGQWLDRESMDVLRFVARRLETEPVGLIIALSEGETAPLDLPGATHLSLAAIGVADALAIVRDRVGAEVSPLVGAALVDAARGNPLLLIELAASLSRDELAGRVRLPEPLPIGASLESLYLGRVRALPSKTQEALLVAAAEGTGSLGTIAAALAVLGFELEALDPAEAAGLVHIDGGVLFPQPLIRSAIYGGAAAAARRRVHQALASVLSAEHDRYAWHRAAAAIGPDEGAAMELECSAEGASARSGCAAAASALERAAALSPDQASRARRLARAAELAWIGGQAERALALGVEAEANGNDPLVGASVGYVRASFEIQRGMPSEAVSTLLEAADSVAELDPPTALRLLLIAVQAGGLAGQLERALRLGPRTERLLSLADTPEEEFLTAVFVAVGWASHAREAPPAEALRIALARADQLTDPRLRLLAIPAAAYLGDVAWARANADRATSRARAIGAIGLLPFALQLQAFMDVWAGRFGSAGTLAAEGLRLATETDQENLIFSHHALLAVVAAVRGEDDVCRDEAEAALQGSMGRDLRFATNVANLALGQLELGLGHPAEALDRLELLADAGSNWSARLVSIPDLVEAAARAGQPERGARALVAFERWVLGTTSKWGMPLLARCRALIADGDAAERHFRDALALDAEESAAWDRARTELLYGEFVRRGRRRVEARPHLRWALETFASVGARLWEARAENELRATGETAHRRDPSAMWQLTPQETQIARLVALGASNRDVAGQLFLSPRTVEYHLRKVFVKLGVSSRDELGRLPVDNEAAHTLAGR